MHTVIDPIISYSLSEVALSCSNEKTTNGTLSQEEGRTAPGMGVQWQSAEPSTW